MTQDTIQQQPDALDGERGMPSVNERRSGSGRKALLLLFVVGFVVILLALLVFHLKGGSAAGKPDKKAMQTSTVPTRTFSQMPPAPAAPAPAQAVPMVQASSAPADQPERLGESAKAPAELDKSSGSLMIAIRGADAGAGSPSAAGESGPAGQDGKNGSGPLSALLSGTRTDPRKASVLQNRDFLLAKGSFINCALQTRLDSTVPGMTSCVVTRNVYSDDGKVLLIERGSTVAGEYQSNLRQGMARIYVLWTRVKTPNGVVVNLDSPGSDALGGAGLPGHVNNHFWKRFGGAMMLSLVDDVARAATQNSSGSGQVNLNSTGDATTDMAAIALRDSINIPPTLYKNQGEEVGIYIARDLDFSSVYDVQPK